MHVYRIVNSVLESNTYCIWEDSSDDMWLIDCGDADEIIKLARSFDKTIKSVFLTHSHYDHIYGLNDLNDYNPEFIIYTNEFGAQALKNSRINLSRFFGHNFEYKGTNIHILDDNNIFGALMVPGHDPSSMCYLIKNYLFTGDSYLLNFSIIDRFPNSNKEDAKNSEDLIKSLWVSGMIMCPGHGDIGTK